MTQPTHPAFGTADLTNCERELIHLAGSVMPHGGLLVVDEPSPRVLQVSANAQECLGGVSEALLGRALADWNPPLAATVQRLLEQDGLEVQVPLHARVPPDGAAMEGLLHRTPTQGFAATARE
jgi:chemotaxis family two-component system sensor kinase Cph1